MVRAAQYGRRSTKRQTNEPADTNYGLPNQALKPGGKDWFSKCTVCGEKPCVYPTKLCGPHTFGENSTRNGKW